MAYSEGKSSTAYIGFFEGKTETSLPTEAAIDLERELGKRQQHLSHMPNREVNEPKEQQIHQARNKLRMVVGMMLLPPLEPRVNKADTTEVEQSSHAVSLGSSS